MSEEFTLFLWHKFKLKNITSSVRKETCTPHKFQVKKGQSLKILLQFFFFHISRRKKGFRRQDKENVWFIICDKVTLLCLHLDGSYQT